MSTTSQTYSERSAEAAGLRIQVLQGGSGAPLLVLHHDIGNPGWLPVYEGLSGYASVLVPSLPGFGGSERPEWMRSVRDMAIVVQALIANLDLSDVSLVGLGFGGWIAAEMATMAPRQFRRLVLVGAMGLQPREGEILDQAILSHHDYVRAGFHNPAACDAAFGAEPATEQLEAWDVHREMCFRIAWRPYMYSQTLPHLLGDVKTPALVVWGREDRVVPLECGERYAELLPQARLEVLNGCGHVVEMEQPEALLRLVSSFLAEA